MRFRCRGFADTAGHWAEDIIGTAKSLGLVDGIGGNLFEPDQYIERQSAAKLIAVGLFRGELKDGDVPVIQHFPDIPPDLWSFGWVEEASSVAHESVHRNIGEESLILICRNKRNLFEHAGFNQRRCLCRPANSMLHRVRLEYSIFLKYAMLEAGISGKGRSR
ncbi:S-layer homology domain-containing protein [Ferviditalea candida]|uniref:S-layer homology domain-containing protein n=1 Tax=Ferviditalea candida TaxID=3108399 RepID=A0ABU5ZGK2_9BACL|nr:S-layer homology domain-containing protein [Paenibacillaceae bacterium T2]